MCDAIPVAAIGLLSPLICRRGSYGGSQQNLEKRDWESGMRLTRREAIAGCGRALACLVGSSAVAQSAYPNRTIKMIVPYPAGGTTDLLGRLIADQLRTGLGATVVVENKTGAAAGLGVAPVA